MPNYLDQLYTDKPADAYVSTWMKKSNAVRFFHTSEFDQAEQYMLENAKYDDVYFAPALLKEPPAKGRGKAKDVGFVSCLHADFDMLKGENVHSQSALPKDLDELTDFLDEIKIPKPSFMINSGNGIHAYWKLSKTYSLDTEERWNFAAKTLLNFQKVVIDFGKKLRNWKFDNTADLARVLRYPGTLNHKTNPPKLVEIIR